MTTAQRTADGAHGERRPATMTARPSIVASVLAVGAAAATVVTIGVGFVPVVAIELAGVLAVAGGLAHYRRGGTATGMGIAVAGGSAVAVAIGLAVAGTSGVSELLWVVPGVVGVALVGLAVAPLRGSGTRWLVKAGTGGLLLSVGLVGLFRAPPLGTLLLAMAGTVLAWDAGEHAIDVGRQLGRTTSTWRLDAAHVGATAAVGVVSVMTGHAVAGIRAGKLSLSAYALLFLALLGLTLALHR